MLLNIFHVGIVDSLYITVHLSTRNRNYDYITPFMVTKLMATLIILDLLNCADFLLDGYELDMSVDCRGT